MYKLYKKILASQSYWLVSMGILFISIGLPVTIYFGSEKVLPARNIPVALPWLFLFSVFLAPLIEEVSFRGFFTSRRWIKIIALFLLTGYVLLNNPSWIIYSTFAAFVLFTLLSLRDKSTLFLIPKYISNSFLFGIIHWEISDLTTFIMSFVQFGLGLILLWIVLNFGIIRSILFHSAYNFSLMVVLFFSLQFPNDSKNYKETENYRLEWNRVPYFSDSNSTFKFTNKGIISRSLSAKKTYSIISAANQGEDLKNVVILEPYMKYNISLTFKDSVPDSNIIDVLISELDSAGLWTDVESTTGIGIIE